MHRGPWLTRQFSFAGSVSTRAFIATQSFSVARQPVLLGWALRR